MSKERETLLAILTEHERVRNYVERLQGLSFNDSQALARHIKAYVMQAFEALPKETRSITRLDQAKINLLKGDPVSVVILKSLFVFKKSAGGGYKLWMRHMENPVPYRQIDIPLDFIQDFLEMHETHIAPF